MLAIAIALVVINLLLLLVLGLVIRNLRRWRSAALQSANREQATEQERQRLQEQQTALQQLQVQLLHERQQCEQAQQSRNLFMANISHEVRTPLSGILGILSLLEKTPLSSEQQDYLHTLQSSSEHLLAIVSDILDLSRIDANRLEIVEESFSLTELLQQLLALVQPRAQQKQLQLEWLPDASLPELLRGDPVRIRQILMNFLTNAIKFTEQGKVILSVKVLQRDAHKVMLRLLVEDTGIGIAATQAHKLFDEFSFAHGSLSERAGGTGLGLSICRRLAGLMHGKVGVVSTPGQGSLFWLELPLGIAADDVLRTAKVLPSTATEATPATDLQGLRVLLAEDNPVNQKIAVQMLTRLGCAVTVADDGVEAVRLYQSDTFDAVLMDCHMPVLDGLEATRQIRALAGNQVPVIALSADVTTEQRHACIGAGMSAFLSKPVRQQELWQVLHPCLRAADHNTLP